MTKEKATLICVYDPLCGWCFGFGPVLIALQKKWSEHLNFDIISGGMITGNRIGPLSNMAAYIKNAYQTVERHTGIRFGKRYIEETLEKGTATNSSLEPAMMLNIFKRFQPGKAVVFSHDIQKLLFIDGIDPIDFEAYLPLFKEYGIEREQVEPLWNLKETQQETIKEFKLAQTWGINGFPTCVLQSPDGKAFGVNRGFEPMESLDKKLSQMLGVQPT